MTEAAHRHARAVILLGGWLLMTPPLKDAPKSEATPGKTPSTTLTPAQQRFLEGTTPLEPDARAPITQWMQIGAFDSAKECETARAKHLPTARAAAWELPPGSLPIGVPGKDMGWYFARCVLAEAVYPPPQPQQGR